ncbi:MAG: A24 family peptidase [Gemmataceae bacterium]|nr:A24 family peptidase [Gemmata sp.]MDW8198139.1 A24 family peptidase [Gemmataceae bacterium]
MSQSAPVLEQPMPLTCPANPEDSLGLDRAFLLQMARMPLVALLWVAASWVASQVWAALWPIGLNAGPLVVVCFGMILAAFIDGWALKVPNWITLPLILSGWMLGALHDFGLAVDAGRGGFGIAFLATVVGFVLLFPMLAIRGVGEGDVKMQMGFGAWVGAYFGTTHESGLHALGVVFWAFAFGAIVGGAFGLVIILLRRRFGENASMLRDIFADLRMIGSGQITAATQQAQARRARWTKLPYGIPLCVGFIMYLLYMLVLMA